MRVLTLDIETSPILGYTWGMWDTNVVKVKEAPTMMCVAAKWLGDPKVMFFSEAKDGRLGMLTAIWSLLDDADAVIHFNGQRFDIPHINREFLLNEFRPPSPFKQIDLLLTARRRFKFPSNKLDYLTQALGMKGKFNHAGFKMWEDCLAGDAKAWKMMEKYNKQDVRLTEDVYSKLLPWIPNHPSFSLYDGVECCPTCADPNNLMKRGFAYTKQSKFQQFQCMSCSSYFRSTKRVEGVSVVDVVR